MTTQGDDILMDMVQRDIKRLEAEDSASLCSHCGMLTLLKCKEAELKGAAPVGHGAVAGISGGMMAIGIGLLKLLEYLTAK